MFDGLRASKRAKTGIVIVSPNGLTSQFAFELDNVVFGNQANYEALIIGLELLFEKKVKTVNISGDLQLVVQQLGMIYRCLKPKLANPT